MGTIPEGAKGASGGGGNDLRVEGRLLDRSDEQWPKSSALQYKKLNYVFMKLK